jgi:pimeloyl-ACP methyl ester carboxylesterase
MSEAYPPERINFSFAPDGSAAACLASLGPREVVIESYSFAGAPSAHRIPVDQADGSPSFVTPAGDDRVLLARGAGDHRAEFVLLDAGGEGEVLGRIDCDKLRMWPSPDPGTLALVTCRTGEADGAVWTVAPDGVRKVVELPGLQLVGGDWLDGDGRRFGVNRRDRSGLASPVAVEPAACRVEPLLPDSVAANRILQLGEAGGPLVASDEQGGFLFGLGSGSAGSAGSAALRFPPGLNGIEGSVLPLTADRRGERIALHVGRGVRSHVVIYHVGEDRVAELELPLGTLAGPAQFGVDGHGEVLRLAFSTPEQPTEILTVPLYDSGAAAFVPPARAMPMRVRTETFAGPAGDIEALVYGDPDWRAARQVLIALHGGPEDAWRPRFDPLLQRLEAAGLCVVAPNQRGSTHYGGPHQDAVRGAWGGPDLADVRHLAATVAAEAPGAELLLYGLSYGAYLALLAAGADPLRWRRCVAVAPFLSGARLYPEASASVRRLLERLDGRAEIDDELGPRDVLRFAPRSHADLLVVHGEQDATIPVGQSRTLRDELLRAGRREGAGFGYLEVPGEGHYPRYDSDGGSIHQAITEFLLYGVLPARTEPIAVGA